MSDWFFLFRPWSYIATLVPFLVAAGLCAGRTGCHWTHWVLGLLSGLLFQATVNLLNTWGDEKGGVDDVPGAIRTTPQVHEGRVSMNALLGTALICAALASVLGLGLCFYHDGEAWSFNVPLVCAGALGFLGATNYTTGIKFKYRGLGVPFVSFLMGPLEIFVACALLRPGTQPHDIPLFLCAILPIAALVGVVMHGNDMRDMPTDRAAGIVTFAIRLEERGALSYYCLCHTLPYLITILLFVQKVSESGQAVWLLLPLFAAPLSIHTTATAIRTFRTNPQRPPWIRLERASGRVLLAYGALHALALALR